MEEAETHPIWRPTRYERVRPKWYGRFGVPAATLPRPRPSGTVAEVRPAGSTAAPVASEVDGAAGAPRHMHTKDTNETKKPAHDLREAEQRVRVPTERCRLLRAALALHASTGDS